MEMAAVAVLSVHLLRPESRCGRAGGTLCARSVRRVRRVRRVRLAGRRRRVYQSIEYGKGDRKLDSRTIYLFTLRDGLEGLPEPKARCRRRRACQILVREDDVGRWRPWCVLDAPPHKHTSTHERTGAHAHSHECSQNLAASKQRVQSNRWVGPSGAHSGGPWRGRRQVWEAALRGDGQVVPGRCLAHDGAWRCVAVLGAVRDGVWRGVAAVEGAEV